MGKQYITLKQAAEKWKTKAWYIAKACDEGQIPEAVKLNEGWIIPADLERPKMHIKNKTKCADPEYAHGDVYKDAIYRMTMDGFPNFDVHTYEFGNTTYHVYSCFSADTKETLAEKAWGFAVRKASEEGKKEGGFFLSDADQRELKREIREEEISIMPLSEELRNYYYQRFVEIGFSEKELLELMAKIDEHVEKRNKNFGIE